MDIAETLIGKNMKAHPEALGLYIGLDEMYIAQSSRKDGGVVLESLLRVPISSLDRSQLKALELNEGFFAMDNWLESLKKVAARKKWQNRQVVVSLAPAFSLLRHFVIPTVIERKHWKEAIPLQARKYIHFPFEKTLYSYHVYEFETAATKQKRLGVIFTMTPKTAVERLEKGLRSVGLDPVAIEVSAISLSRAFSESDKEAVDDSGRIYSFFGSEVASFIFTNHHAPVLLREVEIAGALPVERRRLEISNCTEFIGKQLEKDPFDEAVIMGHEMDNWTALLEAESKKPVRKWDLKEIYGIETKSAGEISAIGASMKFYDSKGPDLDFIKRNRLSEYEFNAGLMFWKVTAVVVAIFLCMFVKGFWKVHSTQQELNKAKRSGAKVLPDFEGLTANQIETNLKRVKDQNKNLEQLLKTTNKTAVLVDLNNTIPQTMWISKFSYTEPFPAKKGEKGSFNFEGFIKTGNSETDLSVGKKFYEEFTALPSIKSLCGNKAEIKYKDLAIGGGTGRSSRNANANSSKETSFTFTCSGGGNSGGSTGAKGGFRK